MKGLALIALAVMSCFGSAQDRFPDIPTNHDIYRFAFHLRQIGWLSGPPLSYQGAYSGPPQRRSIFALAGIASISELPKNLRTAIAQLESNKSEKVQYLGKLNMSDSDRFLREELIWGFKRWVDEFSSDIAQLGTSKSALLLQLDACRTDIERLKSLCDRAAKLQKYFPDVPENHSFYRFEHVLDNREWLHPPGHWYMNSEPRTRSHLAKETIGTIMFLYSELMNPGNSSDEPQEFTKPADDLGFVHNTVVPWLRRWVIEFAEDIKLRGGDPKQLMAKLDECQRLSWLMPRKPSFTDIPGSHWASVSVQELKDLGILIGYPDGKFRGQRN